MSRSVTVLVLIARRILVLQHSQLEANLPLIIAVSIVVSAARFCFLDHFHAIAWVLRVHTSQFPMSQPPHGAVAAPPAAALKVRGSTLRLEVVIDDLPEQLEGHLKLQMPAEIKVQEAAASASRSKQQLTAVGDAEAS